MPPIEKPMDGWLRKRLDRYDEWLSRREVTCTSRVIPVSRSLESFQWVLPAERVFDYLRNARSFGVADCVCRTHYQLCDNPRNVCFFINDAFDRLEARGDARALTLEEAGEKLKLADAHGLVHLALYDPRQHPFAICSCCRCCCHDLRLLLDHGRRDLVARSEYAAVQDEDACVDCGECMERCVFGARTLRDGRLTYSPEACYGCGLCISACPAGAVSLARRPG